MSGNSQILIEEEVSRVKQYDNNKINTVFTKTLKNFNIHYSVYQPYTVWVTVSVVK
jgi:hypothetical protein